MIPFGEKPSSCLVGILIMSSCIEWKGGRDKDGYGYKNIQGRRWRLHRFVWTWVNGPIPKGMWVLHACDNPPCCNPDHLFLGNAAMNSRDRDRKGRNGQTNKTHCPRGHEYTKENTRIYTDRRGTARFCRECKRLRRKEQTK